MSGSTSAGAKVLRIPCGGEFIDGVGGRLTVHVARIHDKQVAGVVEC